MKETIKRMISVLAIMTLLCFGGVALTGCGDDYDDYDDSDSGSSYDDWDTDDNGEADWHDVDTDNDGNVSDDEFNDYLDDWEEELN